MSPGTEPDGTADGGRDVAGVADVENRGLAVKRRAEQPAAQDRSQPVRARDEFDGQLRDGMAQCLPRLRWQCLRPPEGQGAARARVPPGTGLKAWPIAGARPDAGTRPDA